MGDARRDTERTLEYMIILGDLVPHHEAVANLVQHMQMDIQKNGPLDDDLAARVKRFIKGER